MSEKPLQTCVWCGDYTDRCEDDEINTANGIGPLCLSCWDNVKPVNDALEAAYAENDQLRAEVERLRDQTSVFPSKPETWTK